MSTIHLMISSNQLKMSLIELKYFRFIKRYDQEAIYVSDMTHFVNLRITQFKTADTGRL